MIRFGKDLLIFYSKPVKSEKYLKKSTEVEFSLFYFVKLEYKSTVLFSGLIVQDIFTSIKLPHKVRKLSNQSSKIHTIIK